MYACEGENANRVTLCSAQGFFNMTSARIHCGPDSVATFHIPTEISPLVKVTKREGVLELKHVDPSSKVIKESKKTEGEEEASEESFLSYETERTVHQRDPAMWFGVRPYQYMKSAKANFEESMLSELDFVAFLTCAHGIEGLSLLVKIANAQSTLLQVEQKVKAAKRASK